MANFRTITHEVGQYYNIGNQNSTISHVYYIYLNKLYKIGINIVTLSNIKKTLADIDREFELLVLANEYVELLNNNRLFCIDFVTIDDENISAISYKTIEILEKRKHANVAISNKFTPLSTQSIFYGNCDNMEQLDNSVFLKY